MYTLITGTTNRNYIDVEWQKQKNLAMVNMMAVMQLSYMFKKMKVDTAKEVAEKSYKAMMKNIFKNNFFFDFLFIKTYTKKFFVLYLISSLKIKRRKL